MNLLLCAYHWVGCQVLQNLVDRGEKVNLAVFTHEPGPTVPDVREIARRYSIPYSTENISRENLPFTPDVIASVYYRNIIRPSVIASCAGRIFNVHPSLLPRHRGCSSVPWAIIDGDQYTGVTFHYIDEGIDTGKIILQATFPLSEDDTQASVFQRCMKTASDYWPAAFELVRHGWSGVPQEGPGNYHRRGAPFNGEIDPTWSEQATRRFIRAMDFPPFPYARFNGHEVRNWEDYLRLNCTSNDPRG